MSLEDKRVDINCDLGEIDPSLSLERSIMPLIGRCNIAAGGHAGTPETMRETIFLALNHGVEIGAHPSYPDKEHFGRKRMEIADETLIFSIKEQISTFLDEVENCGATIDHIKAHGALYHYLNENETAARLYLEMINELIPEVKLMVPEQSVITRLAVDYPMALIFEAFADRRYNKDKSLQARTIPGSVISDPKEVTRQVGQLINKGGLMIGETFLPLKANSICVHSDTENAIEILEAIKPFFK